MGGRNEVREVARGKGTEIHSEMRNHGSCFRRDSSWFKYVKVLKNIH